MARGYLNWSVAKLEEVSGVSATTIKRMEKSDGIPKTMTDKLVDIRRTFETAGLEFIPENGHAAGVRPRNKP
ncbi:transcriptional regulator [Methylobacterium sp. J-072]|uniref:transcriptional regulator n=1 Tax=Methylobacterium sp. J-072 TaxID=2836651 RepID=UPI001FB9DCE8|nr:transcriptional regulator [Methylobacterium sp. J-072]MCJ2092047.1 transcriptional regulator [Methylobacterium sp. J-072]